MKTIQNRDVPDEVWLKCFIEDYRRLSESLETLEVYTRQLEERYREAADILESIKRECGTDNLGQIGEIMRNNYKYRETEKKRSEKIKNFHRLVHYCFENGLTVPKYIFNGNEEDE